ncbi:MAG: ribulose-phosphate 3-epimerase [bacterium]
MKKVLIAPSLMSADFASLKDTFDELKKAGCDYVHLDVMDGAFVPNITFGQMVVRNVARFATLPLDAHLMIEEPGRYVADFALPGVRIICVHVEACRHLDRVVQQIAEAGKVPGVALNPATPVSSIEWVLDRVGFVLVMSVNPGFGGQEFIGYSVGKIEAVRRMLDARGLKDVILGVDGGVNERVAPQVVNAGADFLVTGSYLFNVRGGPAEAVKRIRRAIGKTRAGGRT